MAEEPRDTTPPYGRMAFHAVLAGLFFFGLNRFALGQSTETSLIWAAVASPFAAYMAFKQRLH
jgi:hypothetical protein